MTHGNDQRLDQLIATAPREITPSNDNWRAIADRLDKPQLNPGRNSKQLALAIGSAAILLLLLQPFYLQKSPVATGETAQVPDPATMPVSGQTSDEALLSLIDAIEVAHDKEVTALAAPSSVAWQRTGLQGSVNASLDELRQGASQILLALKANPNDKQLWQLWLWVQRRELELLTQGQRLPTGRIQGDTL